MDNSDKPLVSVTVPTLNSERTLVRCLESVRKQSWRFVELLVIDSFSTDATRAIAQDYGAQIVDCPGRLLAARWLGVQMALGEFVLLLDTDQVLRDDTIERAVARAQEGPYDMLVLEEESYDRSWVIPRLYAASKVIINARFDRDYAFDPVRGGNPPRFFRRELLMQAFDAIPAELLPVTVHYDHDIIYYEAYQLSQKAGLLRNAILDIEPDWRKLWRTNVRYGASLRVVQQSRYWEAFLKRRGSGFQFGKPLLEGTLALLLHLLLRAAQLAGYHLYGDRALGPVPAASVVPGNNGSGDPSTKPD